MVAGRDRRMQGHAEVTEVELEMVGPAALIGAVEALGARLGHVDEEAEVGLVHLRGLELLPADRRRTAGVSRAGCTSPPNR